jgi:hypothetical protein
MQKSPWKQGLNYYYFTFMSQVFLKMVKYTW